MRYSCIVIAGMLVLLAGAQTAFCQKTTTEIPWSSDALAEVLKEAKDRNVPIFLYSGNDT